MTVMVTRDGKVYFGGGADQRCCRSSQQDRGTFEGHGVEWKVYIAADMRLRWGAVKASVRWCARCWNSYG